MVPNIYRTPENHQPAAFHWQILSHNVIKYTSTRAGFELATLVVIGTDCIGSCKSNNHTMTTTICFLPVRGGWIEKERIIVKVCVPLCFGGVNDGVDTLPVQRWKLVIKKWKPKPYLYKVEIILWQRNRSSINLETRYYIVRINKPILESDHTIFRWTQKNRNFLLEFLVGQRNASI